MNIKDAYMICNPLASPPLGIDAHLAEEQRTQDELEAINARAKEILSDPKWLNTLEDLYPDLDRYKNYLRDAAITGGEYSINVESKTLARLYKLHAHKLAEITLKREREDAEEDSAFARIGE